MQLRQIAESGQALQAMGQLQFDDPKISYRIGRALAKTNSVMKQFELDRKRLFGQLGIIMPTPQGDQLTIPADKQEEFQKNFEALLDEEVMIDNMPVITIADFVGVKTEPAMFTPLDWLIKETALSAVK